MSRKSAKREERRHAIQTPASRSSKTPGTGTPASPPSHNALVHLAYWTLVFLAVLLSTRLVNLGQDVLSLRPGVINNDESTFIIIASGVLHGHLPYTEMYDLKPPGIYLVFAGVMALFGESLHVVRHFGTFCLLGAAVASYGIAIRHTTSRIAGLSIAAVMTLTGVANFQPTMTETVVIAVLMPALWLLVSRRGVLWAIFLVGVLVSVATLTRTNIAYVALALAGYYLWRWWRGRPSVSPWEIIAYGAGGIVPLASLIWIYWRAGALYAFVFFNVTLPISYAYGQLGTMDALVKFMDYLLSRVFDNVYAFSITLFTMTGLCLWVVNGKKALLSENAGPLVLVFGALGLSILQSGQGHPHYLLQLLPLVAVFTAFGFGTLCRRLDGKAAWVGVALSVLVLVSGLVHYGSASVSHVVGQWESIRRSPLQRAADLIREDAGEGPVWAPTHHLIYWYLKQPPPSKLVHPDGVNSMALPTQTYPIVEHGYLASGEFRRVMEGDHGYIVVATDVSAWQFMHPVFQEWFDTILETRFVRWKDVPGFVIYKRR